jgi:hypothetical protein
MTQVLQRQPPPVGPRNGQELAAPQAQRRRVRPGEVILGVFLVVVFALAGVVWSISGTTRRQVLALRHDVGRGVVVRAEDLRVIELATDAQLATVAVNDSTRVVGRSASTDLPAGTVVTPELFVSTAQIPAGQAVVGLRLEPGELPSSTLRPGDVVDVILTGKAGDATVAGRPGEGVVLVRAVPVTDIVTDGDQGRRFVSLTVSDSDAAKVSAAAAQKQVRLAQVPGSR